MLYVRVVNCLSQETETTQTVGDNGVESSL